MTSAEKAKEQYFEWQPHDDPDFAPLICGKGTIGGKGRSLLFALRRLRDSGDPDMSRVKVPRSIYLSIEIFHKFLERVPSLDTLLACGDPEGMERVFLLTPLPEEVSLRIRQFLADMNDPVVIRSSSRLEDDVKHSFAGKYLSTFLGNNKGTLEERAQAVEDEVRRIYSRTFFPATNAGVETFLQEKGYSSVEDIPEAYCDTLVRTSIVERIIYTYDLPATSQENNELDLPLIFETSGDTVDAQQMALTIINRCSAIVNEMKNDSVENGVVHPVDRVIVPSTSLGSTLLDENHADFEIWYEALRRTGLTDSLYRYRDEAYEQTKKNYEPFTQSMRIGNEDYVAKLPDHRYSGFTLFIVPDKVFYEKYGAEKVWKYFDTLCYRNGVHLYDLFEMDNDEDVKIVVSAGKEFKEQIMWEIATDWIDDICDSLYMLSVDDVAAICGDE